ncbi:DNA primase [Paenibacillus sp. CFBP 13594]|uniref:DNA primase n=1 Tax=Paenibacillus sp. CFBP 13594 TaxID=2774037 RepID=UPI00177F9E81|nr:DNA primase [Paenibacillus sp. CFBP 13594]MBD8836221.1 DNA primase [Paenibacillus sp. CFBP 13594]
MSDSLKLLKERIYDEGTIGQLLDELGCLDIKIKSGRSGDDLVTARLPGSKNPRGAQIYLNETLHTELVGEGISGDIYALVGFVLYECKNFDEVRSKLYQIKTYICNALGYEHTETNFPNEKPKTDWNWWLRDIQKQRPKIYEVTSNPVLDDRVLNEFILDGWYDWIGEGIDVHTQREFGIGYHLPTNRVSIPIHNSMGKLIGVKGRYVGLDKELLAHKKYSYIYPCSKAIELFNLHRSRAHIQDKKKVYIVEGAKTAMTLWGWGIKNSVSIEGDRLSPVQVKLLKDLGIDIDLVFMWDKGKDEEFVLNQLRQIKGRRVYYVYDNKDIFADKMSPVDEGKEQFNTFLNDCICTYSK